MEAARRAVAAEAVGLLDVAGLGQGSRSVGLLLDKGSFEEEEHSGQDSRNSIVAVEVVDGGFWADHSDMAVVGWEGRFGAVLAVECVVVASAEVEGTFDAAADVGRGRHLVLVSFEVFAVAAAAGAG